jgi:hypothetical protein
MAGFEDWVHLAKSTLHSLETRQVSDLYEVEWSETKRRLIAEHSQEIASEKSGPKRFLRTASAIMFGLTKRLAPQRRVLFVGAQLTLLMSLISLTVTDSQELLTAYAGLVAAFIFITVLLAMELLDKIKFRDELELARALQAELLPKELPQTDRIELAAFNHIANTVGGDIYDFIKMPDGRIAVLFGDASGHGMAAGLIMAVAHATFRTQLEVDAAPTAMFATLNRILCQTGGTRSFFAGAYLLIEEDGRFEGILAGHPPLIQIGSDGRVKRLIGEGAYPLGIKRNYNWPLVDGSLDCGDALMLHSDGLIESRNEQGEEFGDERVTMIHRWTAGRTAKEIIDTLVSNWSNFCGRVAADDDVSIAVIRRMA